MVSHKNVLWSPSILLHLSKFNSLDEGSINDSSIPRAIFRDRINPILVEESEKGQVDSGLYIELTSREARPEEQKHSTSGNVIGRVELSMWRRPLDRREETCFHSIVLGRFRNSGLDRDFHERTLS